MTGDRTDNADSSATKDRQLAPIVLTVYNRAWHTRQTLEALRVNDLADASVLYIYADGPKRLATADELEKIDAVRRLARSERWCREVHVIESAVNLGQVASFVKAISEVVNRYGRVIVLEDDQVTSPGFLRFLNDALEIYQDDVRVMHINAYMYPIDVGSKESTFFLDIQSCPGWATWKRAWNHYNHDAADHLRHFGADEKRRLKFDIEGRARFYRQLERNAGSVEYSFAVRWYASCSRVGGLSLFPVRSLVQNIGVDGSGVHCGPSTMFDVDATDYVPIKRIPIGEDKRIRKLVAAYCGRHFQTGWRYSLKTKIKRAAAAAGAGVLRRSLRRIIVMICPELQMAATVGGDLEGGLVKLENCEIHSTAKCYAPCYMRSVTIGDYTFIGQSSLILNTSVGKFCSFGPKLVCGGERYAVDGVSTAPMFYSVSRQNGSTLSKISHVHERPPVRIGNDVLIGMNVTILPGVTIGDGAVVEAGAVVSTDIPPYGIAAGNPIRVTGRRFDDATVKELLRIKWWDWEAERLQQVAQHIFAVDKFVDAHRSASETSRPGER